MTDIVEVHWDASLVGRLVLGAGMRPSVEFTYDPTWLVNGWQIDPDLPLTGAPFARSGSLFGAFRDSAPDEWGRGLLARSHQGTSLSEADYLLRVADLSRTGALRYRTPDGGWLTADADIPAISDLETLRQAARDFEQGRGAPTRELATAGAGTGGARPKIVVQDDDGLWMAKFGRRDDEIDAEVAEHIVAQLASRAGVAMSTSRLVVDSDEPVLMSRRFDRSGVHRLGYLSALSLLESQVDPRRGGLYDYLELADVLPVWSSQPTQDLHELWRRIAFGCIVGNTDDHMRNHAFIRDGRGWSLSPAFDINTDVRTWNTSVTTVDGQGGEHKLESLLASSDYFRLDLKGARTILDEVLEAARQLEDVLTAYSSTPTTQALRDVIVTNAARA